MADVAGAFKVLIEANPSQANAAFQQILDSANKTASAVKGIDTGFLGTNLGELAKSIADTAGKTSLLDLATAGLSKVFSSIPSIVGATISGLKSFGETMISASSAFADFVSKGGNFNDQLKQFTIYSDSFGQSGSAIIDVFKRVSGGTIAATDAMKIGTKALAAGVTGGDLEKVLTYAKKWSESYGESFEEAAAKAIQSFSTGSSKMLKDIGIFVKDGESYQSVLNKMVDGSKRFGDTGVNLGDVFKAVSIRFEEFKLSVAGAIADSPALVSGIQSVTDSFLWLTNIFGGNKKEITAFFDTIFQAVGELAPNIMDSVNEIIGSIDDSFKDGSALAKTALTTILTVFADVFQEIATIGVSVFNTLMDAASWLGAGITKPMALVETAFAIVFNAIVDGILFLGNTFYDTLKYMANTATSILAKFPKVAEALGLDKFAGSQTALLAEEQALFQGMGDSAKAFTSTFAAGLMGADFRREKFFEGMKKDVPDFVGQAAKATTAIQKIKPGSLTDWDNLTSKVKKTQKHIEVFGKGKAMKDASSVIKKEGLDIGKTFEGVAKAIGDSFKSFSDIFSSAAGAAGGFGKELSAAFSELAGLESNNLISQMDKWNAGDVLKNKIRTMMDAMKDQVAFQGRALTAAEAQAEAQRMLAEALIQAQKNGILHKITVQDFSKFMNDFLADVFKRAGIMARAEGVRISGV